MAPEKKAPFCFYIVSYCKKSLTIIIAKHRYTTKAYYKYLFSLKKEKMQSIKTAFFDKDKKSEHTADWQ